MGSYQINIYDNGKDEGQGFTMEVETVTPGGKAKMAVDALISLFRELQEETLEAQKIRSVLAARQRRERQKN